MAAGSKSGPHRWRLIRYGLGAAGIGLLATGCGNQYVVLHPVGPVGQGELNLMELSSLAMAIVIAAVLVVFFVAVWRFRDRPGNKAPYMPNWHGHRTLEVLWFVIPVLILTIIAIPTVGLTYGLSHVPKAKDPVVIDVTSLQWKWLFQYPGQHIATVNYVEIPTGVPVLFELTADSPMNTFWVPRLGGMEYTMPGRVLPLWLQADKSGVYWGHSGQFSGRQFEKMFFNVKAVPMATFKAWAQHVHRTARPLTLAGYRQLLAFNTVGYETFGRYPASTFPSVKHGFTLNGGMYMLMHNNPKNN